MLYTVNQQMMAQLYLGSLLPMNETLIEFLAFDSSPVVASAWGVNQQNGSKIVLCPSLPLTVFNSVFQNNENQC